jgi:uncharacterized protein (DUF1800 family)
MPDPSLAPIPRERWDRAAASHVLARAGFGGTPEQVDALVAMGPADAVDYLVEYEGIPSDPTTDDLFDASIRRSLTDEERTSLARARRENDEGVLERFQRERTARDMQDRAQMVLLRQWWLKRMIETGRPLEEKMTLFWHGHFATGWRTVEDSYHMYLQNRMLRTHATGDFADLAYRIIRDPAMLRYLDNNRSRRGQPNENLARELMELFVLGEGRGYTEQDIKEAARALTGFTFEDDSFRFDGRAHDDGRKTILGKTGSFDGDDLVQILLSRPECSEFICGKLHRFFVDDSPDAPDRNARIAIARLAELMRREKYRIKPVLRTLFLSRHFHDPTYRGSVVKSPVQLVVQTIRQLGTPPRELTTLSSALDLMGQSLFQPPSVKGWDGGRTWINTSTLFIRQNIAVYLLTGRLPDSGQWAMDPSPWIRGPLERAVQSRTSGEDTDAAADAVLELCLSVDPLPARRAQFRAFARSLGGPLAGERLVRALCMATALPEYQLC